MTDDIAGNLEGVQLHELLFSMSWEDPNLDIDLLRIGPGSRIATVASGGCNALTFLLRDPELVFAFDYNPSQVWTLELKKASFTALTHPETLELFGVRPSARRGELFARVAPHLSKEAAAYWQGRADLVRNGLLGLGRYERFVALFRKLLGLIHGQKKIRALFEERDARARAAFYDDVWNTLAWRLLFKAFFNKTVLSRRGLSPEYFSFDDGSSSFAESFARRTRHALTALSVRDNPFLAQYTLGRYLDEAHLPEYLRPENFDSIRDRLDRLQLAVGDVRDVLERFAVGSFDGICLSNVFELMSEEETALVLERLAPALRAGGRMTLRNLMIPRSATGRACRALVLNDDASRAALERDRSFVYRSIQVYSHEPLHQITTEVLDAVP